MPSTLRAPGQRKSVRWADEAPEDGGFAIGGAALRQLETVYVLEGLGPPKDQGAPAVKTFADQASAVLLLLQAKCSGDDSHKGSPGATSCVSRRAL